MSFDIRNFSSYLCFVHPTRITLPPELDLESFQMGVKPENLSDIIDQLYKMYEPAFQSVSVLLTGSRISDFKFFMKAVIARCVKISEKVTYAHFLLVCTLIKTIITDSFNLEECFMLSNVCFYCLIAVYDRCYRHFFDSNDGKLNTLDSHIVALKKLFDTRKDLVEMRNLPIFRENDVNNIMANLTYVEDEEFSLTEGEQRMLDEMLLRLPVVHPSGENDPSESDSSCIAINAEDVPMDANMELQLRENDVDNIMENLTDVEDEEFPLEEGELRMLDEMSHPPVLHPSGDNDPSKSESSCIAIAEDATECVSMDAENTESTSKSSESDSSSKGMESDSSPTGTESESPCTGINVEDAMECVSVDEDHSDLTRMSSESTSRLSESESSSCRDIDTENSEKGVPFIGDCSYYKNRICVLCGSRCANLAVSYIEENLEKREK